MGAQWQAAHAAQGQQSLATWQTFLATLGTGLLLWTLLETRKATRAAIKANKISRDAYLADQRPWLSASTSLNKEFSVGFDAVSLVVDLEIKNHGRTPAYRTIAKSRSAPFTPMADVAKMAKEFISGVTHWRGSNAWVGDMVFPGETISTQVSPMVDLRNLQENSFQVDGRRQCVVYIFICIQYDILNDPAVHTTNLILNLHRMDDGRETNFIVADEDGFRDKSLALEIVAGGFAD